MLVQVAEAGEGAAVQINCVRSYKAIRLCGAMANSVGRVAARAVGKVEKMGGRRKNGKLFACCINLMPI